MREIKFKYIFSDGVNFKTKTFTLTEIENKQLLAFQNNIPKSFKVIAIYQYTGLKDKNSVKIYEGDIVVCKDYPFYADTPTFKDLNYRGEIYYCDDDHMWKYAIYRVSNRVCGRASGGGLYELSNIDSIEVVGNIYENPELLKDDNE